MEPLVGHLRHPHGLKECVADVEKVQCVTTTFHDQ